MMINKHPKKPMPQKILLFGLPRTKTTIVQHHLSKIARVWNLSEFFAGSEAGDPEEIYRQTRAQKKCVVKLLTNNLFNSPRLEFKKIWECGFDHLVITDRKNRTDALISLYCAERVFKQYHFAEDQPVPVKKFRVEPDFVEKWCGELTIWNQVNQQIQDLGISPDRVFYEQYMPGNTVTVAGHTYDPGQVDSPFVYTNLSYRELCDNYHEVDDVVKSFMTKESKIA